MTRGGKRRGAGRPKGQGRYGEPTQILRVPASMVDDIKEFAATRGFRLPLYSSRVQAGIPTLADDHVEDYIDLNSHLLRHPAHTIVVPVAGESMIGAGIHEGDLLLVDTRIAPTSGKIVVACVDGQNTVKYLEMRKGQAWLVPANPAFKEMLLDPEGDSTITGVVIHCIKSFH